MDPRLIELLGRFHTADEVLTYEEMQELEQKLVAHFDALREAGTAVTELRSVTTDITEVRAAIHGADEAAAAEDQELAELLTLVHTEPETEPEAVIEPEPEAVIEPEPEAVIEPELEPVAAGAAPVVPPRAPMARVARRTRTTQPDPIPPATSDSPVTIVAAGDLPEISAGSVIPDLETLGTAMAKKIDAALRGSPARYHIATFKADIPGERVYDGPRASQNTAIVAAAVKEHYAALAQGLTASGGFCATPSPIYTFQEIHTTARPLHDALTRIPSPRGRVTFMPPANLVDANSGITVHTNANDIAGTTKPCVTITCPDETTVAVDAIPLCIKVGNFDRITFPEHFANFYSVALGQHARVSERALIDKIDANSDHLAEGQNLGAARDILEALNRHAAVRRDYYRMGPSDPVVVALQAWVLDMIRSDLIREAPGSYAERLATSNATIENFFTVSNILPVWLLEGRTGAGQDFALQNDDDEALPWPLFVEAHMFHPSAHFLLELPELNLGTEIRDSTLNSTNDVEAWLETFEGCGFNGLWSSRIRMSVCVSGEASALTTTGCLGS